jgi:hypothetical protein
MREVGWAITAAPPRRSRKMNSPDLRQMGPTEPPPLPPGHAAASKRNFARVIAEVLLAAVAGMAIIFLPVLLGAARPHNYEWVFLPVVPQSMGTWQSVRWGNLLEPSLLFAAGLVLGFRGRAHALLIGAGTQLGLVAWMVGDMAAGGGGHNLFPFELLGYGICALPGAAGASLGHVAGRRWTRPGVGRLG